MQPYCGKPNDMGYRCVRRINHQGLCTPTPTVSTLLDFEARNLGPTEKILSIENDLGLPVARYYQLLNRAIDTQAALEHDAALTYRLQARRETGLRNRNT